MRKFILFLFFRQCTPLHLSASFGHLEVTQLLVDSRADVAARTRCFSLPPSHHLSLTICLAVMAKLHSNAPSTTTKPKLLHTCAAPARRNDAPPRAAPPACCARAAAQYGSLQRMQQRAQEQRKVENIEVKSSMKCQTGR